MTATPITPDRTAATGAVTLRAAATLEDARQLFAWRNDPFIWSRGSSQRTVAWEEHAAWFDASLKNPDRLIYLIEHDGVPAGMVRFDREGDRACVISAYLVQAHVGRGIGVRAIRQACALAFARWPVDVVLAHVMRGNRYGEGGFRKAGFVPRQEPGIEGHDALGLSREALV